MKRPMTKWQQKGGVALYWLTWPGLWLYLRSSQRTRVLVVCDNQVLLVKTWLGDGKWSLPGGGLHKREDPRQGGRRELLEETSLDLPVDSFKLIDHRQANNHGLVFSYDLFVIEAVTPWPVRRQPFEIVDLGWYDYRQLTDEQLAPDARVALRTWFRK